jgi:non-ribosomal peptide synthetase component F
LFDQHPGAAGADAGPTVQAPSTLAFVASVILVVFVALQQARFVLIAVAARQRGALFVAGFAAAGCTAWNGNPSLADRAFDLLARELFLDLEALVAVRAAHADGHWRTSAVGRRAHRMGISPDCTTPMHQTKPPGFNLVEARRLI